jgi:hypothetical protein
MTPELAVFLEELVARQRRQASLNTAKGKASVSGRTRNTSKPNAKTLIEKSKS